MYNKELLLRILAKRLPDNCVIDELSTLAKLNVWFYYDGINGIESFRVKLLKGGSIEANISYMLSKVRKKINGRR